MTDSRKSSRDTEPDDSAADIYQVERLVGYRKRNGREEFRVKWEGYPDSQNTWEPLANLLMPNSDMEEYITETRVKFESSRKRRSSNSIQNAGGGRSKTAKRRSSTTGSILASQPYSKRRRATVQAAAAAATVTPIAAADDTFGSSPRRTHSAGPTSRRSEPSSPRMAPRVKVRPHSAPAGGWPMLQRLRCHESTENPPGTVLPSDDHLLEGNPPGEFLSPLRPNRVVQAQFHIVQIQTAPPERAAYCPSGVECIVRCSKMAVVDGENSSRRVEPQISDEALSLEATRLHYPEALLDYFIKKATFTKTYHYRPLPEQTRSVATGSDIDPHPLMAITQHLSSDNALSTSDLSRESAPLSDVADSCDEGEGGADENLPPPNGQEETIVTKKPVEQAGDSRASLDHTKLPGKGPLTADLSIAMSNYPDNEKPASINTTDIAQADCDACVIDEK